MNEDRSLAGNFELTVVLTDKRQLRMTGYVYSDDTSADINRRVDEWQDVLNRQVIRADIVTKEAEIAQADAAIEALAQHHAELLGLEQAKKLNSQQKQQLGQFEASVRFHKQQKESKAAAIEAARHKLNGAAT